MKYLLDYIPVVLFFVVFKLHDDIKQGIMAATAVLIAATLVQLAVSYFTTGTVEKMPLIAAVLAVVFGGITLLLQDEVYIKWKPTVVNWLFGVAFIASQFVGKKNLVQRMMGASLDLPPFVWARLNVAWVVFFGIAGLLNLYVAFNYSTETWVDFKLFGMIGITLLFIVLQAFYLSRYITAESGETDSSDQV